MPRRGRGGTRQGTPGTSYGNRTDLSTAKVPVAAYTGGSYGSAKASADSQRAVPVQAPPGATQVPPAQPPQPLGPAPGTLGDLTGPTARPNEPLTHGLATGPGAGPEVLSTHPDPDINNLRAVYRIHPSSDLRALIEYMSTGA
jgi:hypothetical protein